jgi:predicted KAP-like P-loop ATPase
MGDLHQNWIMKTELIDQIVENLQDRGESKEYIIDYLTDIIKGLQQVASKQVDSYLDVTLRNQEGIYKKTK